MFSHFVFGTTLQSNLNKYDQYFQSNSIRITNWKTSQKSEFPNNFSYVSFMCTLASLARLNRVLTVIHFLRLLISCLTYYHCCTRAKILFCKAPGYLISPKQARKTRLGEKCWSVALFLRAAGDSFVCYPRFCLTRGIRSCVLRDLTKAHFHLP